MLTRAAADAHALILRSALFNAVFWLSVLVFAPLVLALFFLPPLTLYRVIRQWGRFNIWWLEVTCRLTYTVAGREYLPPGPAIVLAKHQSTWETLAFQFLFPPHVWVLKRELLFIPLFGWAMYLSRPIAIDRGAGRKAVDQIVEQGTQRLRAGHWVLVFPEGTRVAPRSEGRFGLGGSVLAQASGYPIVPVAHNAGSYWPRRGFVKRPGVIRVVIGPCIEPAGKTADEINRRVQEWMRETLRELESVPGGTG